LTTSRLEIRVEWGDCDPARIVFYPNYFSWFDRGTRNLFETVGLPWKTLFDDYGLIGCPIVDAHARFKAPSRFGDVVSVESHIARWSRRSFEVAHRITNGERLAVEGHEVRAWVITDTERETGLRAIDIPEDFVRRFQG